MTISDFGVSREKIADFCHKWKIKELSVFGSAVRGELGPDSDLDLLVIFAEDANWSMFDHYRMENELVDLFSREIDLVNRKAVEENPNWICRDEILKSAQVIYAA
jgi:predicted nucleotidyltransferase